MAALRPRASADSGDAARAQEMPTSARARRAFVRFGPMVSCCILGKYHARLPHRHGNPPQPIRRPNPAVTTPASCLLPSERHPGACHCWCRRGLLGTCVRSRKSEMSHSCRFRNATKRSGLTPHHGPPSAACESDALLRSAASPADLPGYAPRLNGNATNSPDSEPRSSAS
jgi:hypothetical protein